MDDSENQDPSAGHAEDGAIVTVNEVTIGGPHQFVF